MAVAGMDTDPDRIPPLLLLSGLLSDETVWADAAERLSATTAVRIVCFPAFSSIGAMAEHVLSIAPARFALAGHSMGGRVALETWRRAPQRVSALALAHSGVLPCQEQEPASRGRLVRLAREHGMSALAAEWLPPLMGSSPQRRRQVMPRLVAMVEGQTLASFAAQNDALLNRPDARPVLPTIRVPTLVLCASGDAWAPVSLHEEMQRAIPDSTLVNVEDSGHMAPIEQPDAVADALRRWLART